MAGIFDRIGTEDNLPVHFATAAIVLGADGEFTNAQILSSLNNLIVAPLDTAAQTDLLNIKDELLAATGAGGRAEYVHKLESIMIAIESGEYSNETGFRAYLGIS